MTPGAAADAISTHLAETEVTLTGDGGDVVLTGADLGAQVDATALADAAFADRPMWNLGMWMGHPVPADIVLDTETAGSALRAAVPTSFTDPVDAGVVFDAASGTYVITPPRPARGSTSTHSPSPSPTRSPTVRPRSNTPADLPRRCPRV
ncbi:hypothetical protein [Microbacterium sp. Se5.02b]|nr:hypothetical protein [Microbacterium sp. Se5.02b]